MDGTDAAPNWSSYNAHSHQPTAYVGDAKVPYQTFSMEKRGSSNEGSDQPTIFNIMRKLAVAKVADADPTVPVCPPPLLPSKASIRQAGFSKCKT
jgi:hypothetical protein